MSRFLVLPVLLLAVAPCLTPPAVVPVAVAAPAPPAKVRLTDLYAKAKKGMTPAEVEAVLGKPVFPPLEQPGNQLEAYYLDSSYAERALLPHESPFAPAGIQVTYENGRVIQAVLNPQWVRR